MQFYIFQAPLKLSHHPIALELYSTGNDISSAACAYFSGNVKPMGVDYVLKLLKW